MQPYQIVNIISQQHNVTSLYDVLLGLQILRMARICTLAYYGVDRNNFRGDNFVKIVSVPI